MSKPELEQGGGVFRLWWEQEKIRVTIDHLREQGGNVRAEVLIESLVNPGHGHVHHAGINLLSTSGKEGLIRKLSKNGAGVEWDSIIEQACVMVLGEFRKGEPAIMVSDIVRSERLSYRFKPFAPERRIGLLYGDGGAAKSTIAQYLSVMVDTGYAQSLFENEPGRVLYLDYETDQDDFTERIDWIHRGLGIEGGSSIFYRFCTKPLADDVPELQRLIHEHGIDFIVVDSAALACGGQVSDEPAVLACIGACRSFKRSVLIIAHEPKNAPVKTPLGSIMWKNMARSVFHVVLASQPGESEAHVGLYDEKGNSRGKVPAIGLGIQFGDGTVTFRHEDVADHEELAQNLSVSQRIRYALKHGPLSAEALADETGAKLQTVRNKCNDGQRKDELIRLQDGRWALKVRDFPNL